MGPMVLQLITWPFVHLNESASLTAKFSVEITDLMASFPNISTIVNIGIFGDDAVLENLSYTVRSILSKSDCLSLTN